MMIFLPLMTIVILPFIQLGVSYYASVGVVGGLILLWYQRWHLGTLLDRLLLPRLAIVALMVAFTWGYPAAANDLLRAIREAVFYFLLTGCSGWILHDRRRGVAGAAKYIRILCAGLLALVLLQTLFLARGVYFGIPQGLFSQNAGTIAGELDLYYSDIRPNGSYGEPSYLGGVCLCLMFALSPLLFKSRVVRQSVALAFCTVLLSRSFSGIVFYALMLFASVWRLGRNVAAKIAVVTMIVVVCVLVLNTENTISSRLERLKSGDDYSSMARIVQPLTVIPEILARSPTGIPMNDFLELGYIPMVGVYAEELTHNGLLNLVINYGWLGLLAIIVWLYTLPDLNSRIYVVLLSLQNGALLTPDKFVLIALSLMIYNACRRAVAPAAHSHVSARHPPNDPGEEAVYRPVEDVQAWN
jgi:hypothetical protein